MYRNIEDLLADWKEESEFTQKIFSHLTDDSLTAKVTNDGRSIGKISWHIVQTLTEMGKIACIFDEDPLADKPVPKTVKEIADTYSQKNADAVNFINSKIKESMLFAPMEIYGEMWELRKVFQVIIKHQAHHRAQLTVLMRQAGLTVPGIYGPSKEEWSQYNMPPQE